MRQWQILLCALMVAVWSVASLLADVKLPAVFSDHMVLQQGRDVPVWGWADTGEDVIVAFGDVSVKTTTNADGRWSVTLPPLKMSREGNRLTVTGKNTVTRNDVLVGEVWMCSGQSNMQWSVKKSKDADAEIAAANYPTIRLFQTKNTWNAEPQDDTDAVWQVCSPKTIPNFSAVGYYFAREINGELNVPVGMINSSWGGTRIEPWTTPAGFRAVPNYPANAPPSTNQQQSTVLYNTQIHPIVPFALRGTLWYQGEANIIDGMFYADKMRALISGWRDTFRNPSLPIYFVQLAPYLYTGRGRDPDSLPTLWEAQERFAESDAHAGMVVINDIGNTKDIHPTNKQEVGRRLALLALKNDYGRTSLAADSPILEKIGRNGDELVLTFARAKSLATLDSKAPSHFEIAGTDGVFHAADATIRGTQIALTSPKVKEPLLVRYAWQETAEPNVVNEAKLPLGTFRAGSLDK